MNLIHEDYLSSTPHRPVFGAFENERANSIDHLWIV